MFTLGNVLCGLVGLFIDDGTLALAMIAIVMIAGVIATLMPDASLVAGAIWVLDCLGVLLADKVSAGRR